MNHRVGIQTADVINILERLQTADINLELPMIDPSILTSVFSFNPGWIRKGDVAIISPATTINGATIDFEDISAADFTLGFDALNTGRILIENNRIWSNIEFTAAGGTTSPIECNLQIQFPGVMSVNVHRATVPNPGNLMAGPVYVPAGAELHFSTIGNGGVNDTMQVSAIGIQAPTGLPLPLVQSIISTAI